MTLQAQFTIDPHTAEFRKLRSVCEPGNPWRCLIATMGSLELGKRMSVRLDHESSSGIIGVTENGRRYERPMTPDEVEFAKSFDLGKRLRDPLVVRIDLREKTWTSKPSRPASNNIKSRQGNSPQHTKTIRARQLAAIKAAHVTEA